MGGIVSGIVDTVTSLVGGETKAEKAAKSAQEQQAQSLMTIKKEQDKALEERKKRMTAKQVGRASLLSGSELGVQQDALKSTLG